MVRRKDELLCAILGNQPVKPFIGFPRVAELGERSTARSIAQIHNRLLKSLVQLRSCTLASA